MRNLAFNLNFNNYIEYEQKFDFSEENKGCTKLHWYNAHRLLDVPNERKALLCVHPGLN